MWLGRGYALRLALRHDAGLISQLSPFDYRRCNSAPALFPAQQMIMEILNALTMDSEAGRLSVTTVAFQMVGKSAQGLDNIKILLAPCRATAQIGLSIITEHQHRLINLLSQFACYQSDDALMPVISVDQHHR